MITSFLPGRVRLRSAAFKDPKIVQEIERIFTASPFVQGIEHNPVSGSLLLHYDAKKVPFDKLNSVKPVFDIINTEAAHYTVEKRGLVLELLGDLERAIISWAD